MTVKIVELEEHCSSLTLKITALEKQKSRLSQEIEIMILDLEKVGAGLVDREGMEKANARLDRRRMADEGGEEGDRIGQGREYAHQRDG